MTTTIGLATAADVAEVHALDQSAFGVDAWSEDSVRSELIGPNRVALVAREAGVLVGYAISALNGDVLDLQRIAVATDRRRGGLASSLFEVLLSEGTRARAQRLMLEVSTDNDAGRGFYADRGLTEVARRPGYYRDGTDAVVMQMPLGPGPDVDEPRATPATGDTGPTDDIDDTHSTDDTDDTHSTDDTDDTDDAVAGHVVVDLGEEWRRDD